MLRWLQRLLGAERSVKAPTEAADAAAPPDHADDAVVELPIDGELDLHTFRPSDVRSLVPEYVRECQSRGVLTLRIVHGKGRGTLQRIVHAALERMPAEVASFRLAPPERGGWGATLVDLHPPQGEPTTSEDEV